MIHLLIAKATTNTAVHTDQINDMMRSGMETIIVNTQAWPSHIMTMTISLIIIEILVAIGYQIFQPSLLDNVKSFFPKLLNILAVLVITTSYPLFASAVMEYVVSHSGGGAGQSSVVSKGFNPAAVAASGIEKVSVVFDKDKRENIIHSFIGNEKKKTPVKVESNLLGLSATLAEDASEMIEMTFLGMVAFSLFLFLALIVVLVHVYISAMIFVFTMEFYIVVNITSCFLPFGINKHTSYLFTGAINAVIAQSVKMGVLAAVLGLLGDPLAKMTLGDKITLTQMLSMVAMTITVAFMVHRVPAIASAVFPGGGAGINLDNIFSAATSKAVGFAKEGAMGVGALAGGAMAQAMPNGSDLKEAANHVQTGAQMFLADGRQDPLPAGQPDHPMAGGLSLSELVSNNDPIDRASSSGAEAGQPGGLDMYAKGNEQMAQTSVSNASVPGRSFDADALKNQARQDKLDMDAELAQYIKPDGGSTLELDINEVDFFGSNPEQTSAPQASETPAPPEQWQDIPHYEPSTPSRNDGPPDWSDVPMYDDVPQYDEPSYDPSYEDDPGDDH